MANIYSGILSSMTESVASIISNNQNGVMKALATITIVMSIPTIIGSFYGMNLGGIYPPISNQYGFGIVVLASLGITGIVAIILAKMDLF